MLQYGHVIDKCFKRKYGKGEVPKNLKESMI